jgi:pyrroline-5-carboxylate reductase
MGMGIKSTEDNMEVVQFSDIIIIAVKPNVVVPMLTEMASRLGHDNFAGKSFISIAAGISIKDIETCIPNAKSVIRVMPNTPCVVGQSAAAYAAGSKSVKEDKDTCETIFNAVGTISEVPEKLMDAVTGLSGSGPAYVFMLIEALADGGVRAGLPRNIAMQLAAQTVKGAATMVLETGIHPGVLKDQVCSPGGTTIAGVEALEENGFRAAAMKAVVAASNRAAELRNSK